LTTTALGAEYEAPSKGSKHSGGGGDGGWGIHSNMPPPGCGFVESLEEEEGTTREEGKKKKAIELSIFRSSFDPSFDRSSSMAAAARVCVDEFHTNPSIIDAVSFACVCVVYVYRSIGQATRKKKRVEARRARS
jgi:hypothetical protein